VGDVSSQSDSENPKVRDYLRDIGIDRRKMDLNETGCEYVGCIQMTHAAQGTVAGSCDHGNEPSGSIKGEEFLD
jgi:hypothetical protein